MSTIKKKSRTEFSKYQSDKILKQQVSALEEILRAKDGVLKEEGGSQKIAGKARRPYLNRSLVVKGGGGKGICHSSGGWVFRISMFGRGLLGIVRGGIFGR